MILRKSDDHWKSLSGLEFSIASDDEFLNGATTQEKGEVLTDHLWTSTSLEMPHVVISLIIFAMNLSYPDSMIVYPLLISSETSHILSEVANCCLNFKLNFCLFLSKVLCFGRRPSLSWKRFYISLILDVRGRKSSRKQRKARNICTWYFLRLEICDSCSQIGCRIYRVLRKKRENSGANLHSGEEEYLLALTSVTSRAQLRNPLPLGDLHILRVSMVHSSSMQEWTCMLAQEWTCMLAQHAGMDLHAGPFPFAVIVGSSNLEM